MLSEAKPAFVCPDCGQPAPVAVADSCSRPAAQLPSAKPDAAAPGADVTQLNAVAPEVIIESMTPVASACDTSAACTVTGCAPTNSAIFEVAGL